MAIKGKKKSQSRGSQARRRPAAAPRALGPARRRPPWYRTPQGRAAIVVFLLIVIAVITGFVLKARSNSAKLADRQDAAENYTGSIRAVLQTLSPAVTEMTAEAGGTVEQSDLEDLTDQARAWGKTITDAVSEIVALRPPARALSAQNALQQSAQLYLSAARLLALVPDQTNKTRADLLAETTTLTGQAGALWSNGVALLDDYRADLEMDPSGLGAPDVPPANLQPTPGLTAPVDLGGGGNGDGGGKGNGGGGKKGAKNGSG